MVLGHFQESSLLLAVGPEPRLCRLGGGLEIHGHRDDGVSRERHLHDRSGLEFQQQVGAFQVEFEGAASGQEHLGGELPAGGCDGLLRVWLCQRPRAGTVMKAAALGRLGSF